MEQVDSILSNCTSVSTLASFQSDVGEDERTTHDFVSFDSDFLSQLEGLLEDRQGKSGTQCGVLLSLRHSGVPYIVTALRGKLVTFSKHSCNDELTGVADKILVSLVGEEKLDRLILFLESYQITLDFECVTDQEEWGDSGSSPILSYIVLTHCFQKDTLLSVDQTIRIAALFNLVPNETWWIGIDNADAVITALQEIYRFSTYAELWAFFVSTKCISKMVDPPLDHGDIQGQMLKGLVAKLVRVKIDFFEEMSQLSNIFRNRSLNTNMRLQRLVAGPDRSPYIRNKSKFLKWTYKAKMTSIEHVKAVLSRMHSVEFNQKIKKKDKNDYHLFDNIPPEMVSVYFLNWNRAQEDNSYAGMSSSQSQLNAAILSLSSDKVVEDFYEQASKFDPERVAHLHHGHIFVFNDERMNLKTKLLPWPDLVTDLHVPPKAWMLVPYLERTFGNRNIISVLLEHGAKMFLRQIESFFHNWRIPAKQCIVHRNKMQQWALYVQQRPAVRLNLAKGFFLKEFEQFEEKYLNGSISVQANEKPSVTICMVTCVPYGAGASSILSGSFNKLKYQEDVSAAIIEADKYTTENDFEESFLTTTRSNEIVFYGKSILNCSEFTRLKRLLQSSKIVESYDVKFVALCPLDLSDDTVDSFKERLHGTGTRMFETLMDTRKLLEKLKLFPGCLQTPLLAIDGMEQNLIDLFSDHIIGGKSWSPFNYVDVVETKYWALDVPLQKHHVDLLNEIATNTGFSQTELREVSKLHLNLTYSPSKAADHFWSLQQNRKVDIEVLNVVYTPRSNQGEAASPPSSDRSGLVVVCRFDQSWLPEFIKESMNQTPHIVYALGRTTSCMFGTEMLESDDRETFFLDNEEPLKFNGVVTRHLMKNMSVTEPDLN